MKRWFVLFTGVVVTLSTQTVVAQQEENRARGNHDLEIYFIDVQGGAATLLITPERESVLIDSGWPGYDDRDPKRIVHVAKDLAKLERLDHVVTTHWHVDHFGGIEGLSRRIPIGRFWDRGLPEDQDPSLDFPDGPKADDKLGIAYRKVASDRRRGLKAGDPFPLMGEVRAVVVASGGKVLPTTIRSLNPACENSPGDLPVDPSDNARSLALRFRLGKFDFLDCGDLTWNIEKQLVCPVNRIGTIDLYQVTHHGMDISNHPTLVQAISPTVTIMNNGPRKGGSPKTVKLLRSISCIQASYQLHRNTGTGPDDNTDSNLIANTTPEGGQFIHVVVSPDGGKFTVQIGENGPKREFLSN